MDRGVTYQGKTGESDSKIFPYCQDTDINMFMPISKTSIFLNVKKLDKNLVLIALIRLRHSAMTC